MSDTSDPRPPELSVPDLSRDPDNLRHALEHIRLAAALHYLGQGFDPEHMRSIANVATAALRGDAVPPLPDPEEVRARAAAWEGLFEEWPPDDELS